MAPTDRLCPRFAAEPPQETLPHGRWAQTLQAEFLAACLRIESEGEDLGEPGEITWFPDRTWSGRTYVPATARTSTDLELFGYVSFVIGEDGRGAEAFAASADYTDEVAERNPEWRLDLSDEVIGSWRGEHGNVAAITLVWGVALVEDGAVATAELADLVVDQCELAEERFTLVAPDDYRGDILDVKLFDPRGSELASESLYEDDGEDEGEEG
ncbi:MAG: hypothetical protein ACR2ML_11960 [Solirubrobacteraceae bacterium]